MKGWQHGTFPITRLSKELNGVGGMAIMNMPYIQNFVYVLDNSSQILERILIYLEHMEVKKEFMAWTGGAATVMHQIFERMSVVPGAVGFWWSSF